MGHQDWINVTFKKKNISKISEKKNNIYKLSNKNKNIINEKFKFKNKNISLNFKKELQRARLFNKINQKDFASKLNIPIKIINDYESGKAIPNIQLILKMEKLLKYKLPHK